MLKLFQMLQTTKVMVLCFLSKFSLFRNPGIEQDYGSLGHTWWRKMETFSALLVFCAGNSPVTGEFPAQRPVSRSFDVFFDLRPNKRLS